MRVALIGRGRMAQSCIEEAKRRNDCVVSTIGREWDWSGAEEADVIIDFSHCSCTKNAVERACQLAKPIVVGTTGWEHERTAILELVLAKKGTLFFAPNFSIGIDLFSRIVRFAAASIVQHSFYDAALLELHRRGKADRPSGTLLQLQRLMQEAGLEASVESVRCGQMPGTHTLLFDSECDTIELTHRARNRNGFAQGAFVAAEWLIGKQGCFQMEDLLT